MATAYTPNEGLALMANLVFKQADANRGSTLELGLHTNTTGVGVTELANITEPTGGGYARKTLVDANWTVDAEGIAEYAKQTFTATGGALSGTVFGFFLATTGTAPKLLHFQIQDSGVTMSEGESYSVTPKIDFNAGA